jgi:ATP synthase protein I
VAEESMDSGPRDEGPKDDLEARLRAAREREAKADGSDGSGGGTTAGIGIGLRIGVEMVAGLAVGLAIGWGLDRWLGTKPWLMVVFFFLGAAAGILNAYRAASGMDDSVGFGAAQRRRGKK